MKDQDELKSELLKLRTKVSKLKKSNIEHKQAEERITHLNLVLRAIRNVNQLIIKEKDCDRLLQRACDNLIETRGYYNSWIALFDESGKLITTAEAGLGKDFSPMIKLMRSGKNTDCGIKALKKSGVVITETFKKI